MATSWRFRYLQFREHARDHGLLAACLFALYRSEEAVPVEKDLAALRPLPAPPGPGLQLFELGPENAGAIALEYPDASRGERAAGFFRRGYRRIALARDRKVVGDLWYVGPRTTGTLPAHPHVAWFGITLGEDDVYMFDMHVAADERGGGLATYFMASALHLLRGAGVRRAYGYFDAGNKPALWIHRLLGFRELPRVTIRKFLSFERASPVTAGAARPAPGAEPAARARPAQGAASRR